MLIERIHELSRHAAHGTRAVPAHQAVVDLLVLTAYADGRISTDELDALERFDRQHADWDTTSFSVQQYLPIAVAKVRGLIGQPRGADELIVDAASRLGDAAARADAVHACTALAGLGGLAASESAVLSRIEGELL